MPFSELFKRIPQSKRNFWTRLLIGGTALIVSVSAYSSYQVVRNTLLESLKRNAFLEVQQGRDDLDRWLSNLKTHVETLSNVPEVRSMDWAQAEPYLRSETLRFSDGYSLGLVQPDGLRSVIGKSPINIRDRPYFHSAMAGKTTISDPLISRLFNLPSLAVAAPIRRAFDANQAPIGVIQALIQLDRIADVVQSVRYGEGSYAFALDSDGCAIAHPNSDLMMTVQKPAAMLVQSSDPNLAALAQQMVKRQEGIELLPIDGTVKYVAYLPLKEADWSIALVIPRDAIESQLRSLDTIALIVLGLTIAMIAVLWQVQAIEQRQLKQSKDVLEQRVAERTAALSQTLAELQRSQLHLVQSEKMSALGSLVAGVAHEINNPVSFIFGNLNHVHNYAEDLLGLLALYQKYYPTPHDEIYQQALEIDLPFMIEDLPKTVASMRMGADRIRQIVLSLRNFSRLDHAEVKPVDIHEGIDSTLLILQHRLKATSARPEVQIVREYSDLPLIECYAGQLNQVFMNVLSNAIDALEEQALKTPDASLIIRIATQRYNVDRVRIRITDTGSGMSEDVQQRIFDPFFTTKEVGKGTGMGMSISYQIVTERHHGSIWCESTIGQGTTFWIEIPINPLRNVEEPSPAAVLVS